MSIIFPPRLFEVQKLHLKLSNSSLVSVNIKSEGNRDKLALTALLRYLVSSPYIIAKSLSIIT